MFVMTNVVGKLTLTIQSRLNKGTSFLKEWIQVSLNVTWLPRDAVQSAI
jgi:hypothetical protein